MGNSVVSIISPTYNHEKYIGQCIDSVLAQTFQDWEMIIVNDGSTDRTAEVIKPYLAKDSRIHLINQENVGVFRLGETYNKAVQVSTGKFIAILEGDDLWEPDKLERQVKTLKADDTISLAWGKAQLVKHDLSSIYHESPNTDLERDLYNNTPRGSILDLYRLGQFIPAVSIVIRRDHLEKIGGFIQAPSVPLVDFTTISELSLLGRFYFDDHLLGKWRIYSTQTTKKYTVEIYVGIKLFLQQFLPRAAEISPAKRELIMEYFDKLCLIAYARSGRYKLIRKEFKSARKDYIRAIGYPASGKWMWRLRSIIGYGLSIFHLDVEWLAGLLGKKTYGGE
ncbi:MAG: glycosyltransferase [Saprospiraceae bacterium]